jgi:hypothetical protein
MAPRPEWRPRGIWPLGPPPARGTLEGMDFDSNDLLIPTPTPSGMAAAAPGAGGGAPAAGGGARGMDAGGGGVLGGGGGGGPVLHRPEPTRRSRRTWPIPDEWAGWEIDHDRFELKRQLGKGA